MRCAVCNRKLKDEVSKKKGVGPGCIKKLKLTKKDLDNIEQIRAIGYDACVNAEGGYIQLAIKHDDD